MLNYLMKTHFPPIWSHQSLLDDSVLLLFWYYRAVHSQDNERNVCFYRWLSPLSPVHTGFSIYSKQMAMAAARHVKCLKLFVPDDFSFQRQLLAAAKCSVIILSDYLYLKKMAEPD